MGSVKGNEDLMIWKPRLEVGGRVTQKGKDLFVTERTSFQIV
jgi:hypothetical protein